MGQRLFLPMGARSGPHPYPQNEREELLQRLWETNTLMPEARTMEIEALRDYVVAQEEKIRQGHYTKLNQTATVTPEQVRQARGALKEYLDWRRKKQQAAGG